MISGGESLGEGCMQWPLVFIWQTNLINIIEKPGGYGMKRGVKRSRRAMVNHRPTMRDTNEIRRSADEPTHAPDLVGPCVADRAALRSAPPANPGVPALLLKKLTAASAPLRPPREIES